MLLWLPAAADWYAAPPLPCRLKRAGLDYWPFVVVRVHDSWQVGALCAVGPLTTDRSMLAVSVQAQGASYAMSYALHASQLGMPNLQHHFLHPGNCMREGHAEQCRCFQRRGSWLHLQAFSRFYAELPPPKRLIGYSKFAEDIYSAPNLYRPGDWLMFGAETSGLPQEVTHKIF